VHQLGEALPHVHAGAASARVSASGECTDSDRDADLVESAITRVIVDLGTDRATTYRARYATECRDYRPISDRA